MERDPPAQLAMGIVEEKVADIAFGYFGVKVEIKDGVRSVRFPEGGKVVLTHQSNRVCPVISYDNELINQRTRRRSLKRMTHCGAQKQDIASISYQVGG
ncbi:hypothetical protein EV126DRAFT_421357 [Verticillium dahliae]|nr:hypothetical protein EV126DRAFT_421357 [Verticillium dahliae]